MDIRKSKKLLMYLAAGFWGLALMIYLVAGEQFRYTEVVTDALSPVAIIGEIVDGMEVSQRVSIHADRLDGLQMMVGTYGRTNDGELRISLRNESDEIVAQQSIDISSLEDGKYNSVPFDSPIEGLSGEALTVSMTTEGCVPGNAITLYYGNMVTTGRFDIVQSIAPEDLFTINGEAGVGKLCMKVDGVEYLTLYKTYWMIIPAAFLLIAIYVVRCWKGMMAGKENLLTTICTMYTRYGFLLKQLVGRDFKAKYKRSVLGVLWSFINPLMTMAVQYLVFSTLFRSDIPNYPVYLLTGTVFFSFFTEAVGTGMTSITGNAHLIKKVYMPRYIYPFAKVMSSLVNFGFALIPLLLMVVFTGTPIRPSLLLLVFDILCMLGFVMGMVLILSVCMTFFQDTQFLWGIVSMMWMYLTPVFYPESIIPQKLLTLYHMNPMYQYITFARVAISGGVSPAPTAYLWCLISSVVVLLIGVKVFSKYQDELVLYL